MQSSSLIGLGVCLFIVGLVCFGVSVELGRNIYNLNGRYGDDVCNPKYRVGSQSRARDGVDEKPVAKYDEPWWIMACPGVRATVEAYEDSKHEIRYRKVFEFESFSAICTCQQARMVAIVSMALVGFAQFVVGIVFFCIGNNSPEYCCRPRKAWAIFCGFVALFFLFSFISFVLALHFRMNETDNASFPDRGLEPEVDHKMNDLRISFTAFCGIDAILNLIALILSVLAIVKGDKNANKTAAAEEPEDEAQGQDQDEGQGQLEGQGQGSQGQNSEPDKPPARVKSRTSSQQTVKLKRSSQMSKEG